MQFERLCIFSSFKALDCTTKYSKFFRRCIVSQFFQYLISQVLCNNQSWRTIYEKIELWISSGFNFSFYDLKSFRRFPTPLNYIDRMLIYKLEMQQQNHLGNCKEKKNLWIFLTRYQRLHKNKQKIVSGDFMKILKYISHTNSLDWSRSFYFSLNAMTLLKV